jgi:hypothetical protein
MLIILSQSAVVRGAALRGLEGIAPQMKHVRRHYGIVLTKRFREGIDPEGKHFFDRMDNTKRCRDTMEWLISKASNQRAVQDASHSVNYHHFI